MEQNSIETSLSPRIVIETIGGDLTLTGWEQTEVRATYGEEIDIRVEDEIVFVRGDDDCHLHAPHGASLEVRRVGGDTVIQGIHGGGQLQTIGGDLRLNDMGALTIDRVGGDFAAHGIHGDLQVRTIGGDAKVANVQGNCKLTTGGDLQLAQSAGDIEVESGGDTNLRLTPTGQQNYQAAAGGDIVCRLPDGANVTVRATCGGEIVAKRLPAPMRKAEHELSFTMGTGETGMTLTAGGDITLLGQGDNAEWDTAWGQDFGAKFGPEFGAKFGPEFGEKFGAEFGAELGQRASQIAQQVAAQVEQQMDHLARHLDERLAHFGGSDEIAARVQERVQNAMRKAEEKMTEAMRHAEQRMHEAERRAAERQARHEERQARHEERHARHAASWQVVAPPRPPQPPQRPQPPQAPTPVNDEERRMILRMVSEGKISVEQADQLLAALQNPKQA